MAATLVLGTSAFGRLGSNPSSATMSAHGVIVATPDLSPGVLVGREGANPSERTNLVEQANCRWPLF